MDGATAAPSRMISRTSTGPTWSSTAASWTRQLVMRVHARSVSPGVYCRDSCSSDSNGSSARDESVMRRWAIRPIELPLGFAGKSCGHHATIGASGSSRAETRVSVGSASSP